MYHSHTGHHSHCHSLPQPPLLTANVYHSHSYLCHSHSHSHSHSHTRDRPSPRQPAPCLHLRMCVCLEYLPRYSYFIFVHNAQYYTKDYDDETPSGQTVDRQFENDTQMATRQSTRLQQQPGATADATTAFRDAFAELKRVCSRSNYDTARS